MDGTSIADRLGKIKSRINQACLRVGRSASSVNLLAVSKGQSIDKIHEALRCGQRNFGENYVQEALEKLVRLQDLSARWHFIGRIQSNKIKSLVGRFAVIHSVDRLVVAEKLNELSTAPQEIFLQYNVGNEATKGGVSEVGIRALAERVRALPRIRLTGLMVMPPLGLQPGDSRAFFKKARAIAGDLGLNELSMGTSSDFEIAIEEGATWVRVGTEAFGTRDGRE